MEVTFKILTSMTLEIKQGLNPRMVECELDFGGSKTIDPEAYMTPDGPTVIGYEAMTATLVQGLLANIHASHQKKMIDSAAHLRDIIKQLEAGFITPATVIVQNK